MKKQLLGLLLLVACVGGASAAQPAAASCDRECLRSHITQILWSLVKHDVSKLPVAGTLRVTEDAVEKPLKDVALIRSVTALQGYRQDFIDERMGVAGAHVMVEESGAPIMLVVRIKVVGNQLTELELVPVCPKENGERSPRIITNESNRCVGDDDFFGMIPPKEQCIIGVMCFELLIRTHGNMCTRAVLSLLDGCGVGYVLDQVGSDSAIIQNRGAL